MSARGGLLRGRGAFWASLLAASSSWACGPRESSERTEPVESTSLVASAPDPVALTTAAEAELQRRASRIDEGLLGASDARVRGAAARALARIADADARVSLLELLSDEDPEVVRWAAYGVGFDCPKSADDIVSALALRAATLPEDPRFDAAHQSILRALGGCSTASKVEPTLAAWLEDDRRGCGAALALGDLAGKQRRLREETWVLLLQRAEGSVNLPACAEAFYAFSRVPHVPPSVEARLLEVITRALETPGAYRLLAVRAASRAGASAVPALAKLVGDEGATLPEVLEGLRALARIGRPGDRDAAQAMDRWASTPATELASGARATQLLLGALAIRDGVLARPTKDTSGILDKLRALEMIGPDPRQARILSMLRCRAASFSARTPTDVALTTCDHFAERAGAPRRSFVPREAARAALSVLERQGGGAAERELFAKLAADEDPLVRQAALEILPKKSDLPRADTILAALKDPRVGVVIAAVELLARAPSLASKSDAERPPNAEPDGTKVGTVVAVGPDERIVAALKTALARGLEEREPELVDGAVSAVGALGARALVPVVEPLCSSPWPETRKRVEVAMGQLTGKTPTCARPPGDDGDRASPSALAAPAAPRLRLETDAGPLVIELDGVLAPAATNRFLELARRGYFDGNVLHRVDPSYVVQFGSPDGDGYAGPKGDPPLRCETSPLPFEALRVGVALSGRDTGKSQLFVMRARHPHIDGLYPLVGVAQGEWERVVEGDVIRKVSVEEAP